MSFFVYIIQSTKDQKYYIGQTSDVEKRLSEHNRGKIASTKYRIPFILIHHEVLPNRLEAIKRERWLKRYKNTKKLLVKLKN